jgi:hypothetical protein
MFSILDQLVAAYFVADLVAAVYHLATDRGWNTRRIVANFRNHHDRPETMTFDLEPMLGGLPLVALGIYCGSFFVVALGTFLSFAQVPHYFTHHPAPAWIRRLQSWGLILRPSSHHRHHGGQFDRDFCVINGWSNPLINWALDRLEGRQASTASAP